MNYVDSLNLFGVEARQTSCIKINGAPTTTTEGAVGVLAIDIDSESKDVYKCLAVNEDGTYDWEILSSGNGENVQSDWNQKNKTAPDYIKNKPFYIDQTERTTTISEFYTFTPQIKTSDIECRQKYSYWFKLGEIYTFHITGYLNDNVIFNYENSLRAHGLGSSICVSIEQENEDLELEIDGASDWSGAPISLHIEQYSHNQSYDYVIYYEGECDLIKVDITGTFDWISGSLLPRIHLPIVGYDWLSHHCQDILATKEYVNDQLNSIEKSLDNIITKYGLGGDTV